MILDGATAQRTGSDLAIFCRLIMKKVDRTLGEMHDVLVPKPIQIVPPPKPEPPKGPPK